MLEDWHQQLLTRRRFLLATAGGSLASLFPLLSDADSATATDKKINPWPVIDVVQQHLFPAEDDAPGSREINALAYLKFIVADTTLESDSRQFITKGASWLEDMALQQHNKSFVVLNEDKREQVLRRIANSDVGENWLSTLMLYIIEALLSDPVYGGNTDQLGWKWLKHVPGFPRPPVDKTFMRLLS